MHNFWQTPKKPVMVLAPMADVTDTAFRRVIAKYGKPDVTWTEFVSADGLALAPEEGRQKLMKDLLYTETERPIVAQLFSSRPEHMESAARLCQELGFNGVDINMGCPDRSIEKQGCGAAMIKNPEAAVAVIEAAKRGAPDIPVSVKTRVGYNEDQLEEWLPTLLKAEPAVVTVHARTRKEMSKVPARWERIKRAVEIRDEVCGKDEKHTLIFGNGDVLSIVDAEEKVRETGADGVMLGRAIFGNPWLFAGHVPTVRERLMVMMEHTTLFDELLPEKNFAIMKKHYKAYVNGFDGAKELRMSLMETTNAEEVTVIVNRFLSSASSDMLDTSVTL